MINTPAVMLEDIDNQMSNLSDEERDKLKQDLPVNFKNQFYKLVLGNITDQMLRESTV